MPGLSPQNYQNTLTFTLDSAAFGGGYFTHAYEERGTFTGVISGQLGGALTDGAAIAVNADAGNFFTLTTANDNARSISVPTGGRVGQEITIYITNTSGGALTATVFHTNIIQGTVTLMATATSRAYVLQKISSTVWALVLQSAVDLS